MRIFLFVSLLFSLALACRVIEGTPEPASSPSPTAVLPTANSPAGWWQPAPGLSWQWQLGDEAVDTSIPAQVYDIDLFSAQAQVAPLHAQGAKVIAYLSVGSWEDWRPDADQFPPELLGKDYEGWPGEKWLDIRRVDLLMPLMRARLDLAQSSGFDAIEPDNIDIYTNDTGFPLTAEAQLAYAGLLAEEAHSRGLAIGLKNAPDQAADLVGQFDFAITEDCFDQGWCAEMLPFIQAGKAVFAAEYTDTNVDFQAACTWGQAHGFSFILKDRQLNAWLETCP